MNCRLFDVKNLGDSRGSLIVFEEGNNAPFPVRRAFCMYGVGAGSSRGGHANRKSEFVMAMLAGTCDVLVDDGHERRRILLDGQDKALYLGRMVWKEMGDFSQDAILLVLSNEKYDAAEYIRNYDDFLSEVRGEGAQ